MKMVSQTLSLVGLLAIAALIVVIFRGVGAGSVPWLRALGVLIFSGLCFWGAGRIKGRG